MINQYIKEVEQEPFNGIEFTERLAQRTFKETTKAFNAELIHETFTQAIEDLKVVQERQNRKCLRLEQVVREDEESFAVKLSQFQDQHKKSVGIFSELDERINWAGGRALQVGEQLGAAQRPRSRAADALSLLTLLSDFLSPGPVHSEIFNDPTRINEAAEIIQKLYLISQELPTEKFETAKKKIEAKYNEIEKNLIEEFVRAQHSGNMARMKEIAGILTHFKGYSQCVDAFIETSQSNSFNNKDIFSGILPMCENNYIIIKNVFPNPEQVMSKFILNIFHLKLQKYIQTKLADKNDFERYLKNLHEMYISTHKVCDELSTLGDITSGGSLGRLDILSGAIGKPLEGYFPIEKNRLSVVFTNAIQRYYTSKQHTRRQKQGGLQYIQSVIGTRANINIAPVENYGSETFLSEELAVQMLQDAKTSFIRCKTLSPSTKVAANATELTEILVQQLLVEHCDYAVDIGLQSIPIVENKTPPNIMFFEIVKQCNGIVQLFEKHYQEYIVPCLLSSSSSQAICNQKKSVILEQLGSKLDAGLERSISVIVSWVRMYLQSEQKKSDFKPEGDVDTLASSACTVVVNYLNTTMTRIRGCLSGENFQAVTQELGTRLHRIIYEHLMAFQFNSAGAMCAICDVNEYRKVMSGQNIPPLIGELFNTLHALCNLLLVKPENLQQVCEGETLAELDRSILIQFVQLRTDFKSQKLGALLKAPATA